MKAVNGIKPAEKEIGKPSVLTGDSIYYRHPEHGQPHHGVVAGMGKDGMLIDADGGGEHSVEWKDYIAHKARAERKLTIVDRGEDGSIMEDESGKRVFVQGSLEDYAPPLEKSLPVILPPEAPKEHPLTEQVRTLSNLLEAVIRAQAAMAGDIVAAISQLKDSQAAQFQGLCAAISMMSDKQGDVGAMQQAMLAALVEARKPQDISISLPEGMMTKAEPANVQVDVHIPQQAAPVISMEAPIVNVTVPEAAAPMINFSPVVEVRVPEQAAPIVNVTIPNKKTVTEIERDSEGNLKRATQTEFPA